MEETRENLHPSGPSPPQHLAPGAGQHIEATPRQPQLLAGQQSQFGEAQLEPEDAVGHRATERLPTQALIEVKSESQAILEEIGGLCNNDDDNEDRTDNQVK